MHLFIRNNDNVKVDFYATIIVFAMLIVVVANHFALSLLIGLNSNICDKTKWPCKHMMMHWSCSWKKKIAVSQQRMNECVASCEGVGMMNRKVVRMSFLSHYNYIVLFITFQLHICVREMASKIEKKTTLYFTITKMATLCSKTVKT